MIKRLIQGLLGMCLVVLLQPATASATIDHILGGDVCITVDGCSKDVEYPVRQGQTTTVTVLGQYVDLSTGLEVSGSGVTVSSAGGSSSRKSIRIAVASNAEVGLRTVKLHYLVEVNGPDTFKIRIVRNGQVSAIAIPSPRQYFSDVDITFTGENIGNAGLFGNGMQEVSGGVFVGARSSIALVENTSTRAVVHVHFDDGPLAEAAAAIHLFDKSCASICRDSTKFDYNEHGFYKIVGPNAIKTISFPSGSNVGPGNLFAVKVTLLRPVSSQNILAPTKFSLVSGQALFWQLDPSGAFETAPRIGSPYTSSGSNQAVIPIGSDSILLTVRVLSKAPCGASFLQGCRGEVRASLGSANAQYPASQTAEFTIKSN
jgi:hypothetical protein